MEGLTLDRFVIPAGITVLSLLIITAVTGLLVRRRLALFKWHKALAAATVLAALCHGTLAFLASR